MLHLAALTMPTTQTSNWGVVVHLHKVKMKTHQQAIVQKKIEKNFQLHLLDKAYSWFSAQPGFAELQVL